MLSGRRAADPDLGRGAAGRPCHWLSSRWPGGLVDYWSTRLLSSAGLRMAAHIRVDIFTHLQRMSLRYHSSQRVGDLTTRITGDVDRMQDLLVQTLAVLIPNALLVAGMITVMSRWTPDSPWWRCCATPLMTLVVVPLAPGR